VVLVIVGCVEHCLMGVVGDRMWGASFGVVRHILCHVFLVVGVEGWWQRSGGAGGLDMFAWWLKR